MHSETVRLDHDTKRTLQELARQEHLSMQELLARLVEEYRRRSILEQANAAYAAMRADPQASADFDQEHAVFEHALRDRIVMRL